MRKFYIWLCNDSLFMLDKDEKSFEHVQKCLFDEIIFPIIR